MRTHTHTHMHTHTHTHMHTHTYPVLWWFMDGILVRPMLPSLLGAVKRGEQNMGMSAMWERAGVEMVLEHMAEEWAWWGRE